jgi:hypothetical protein
MMTHHEYISEGSWVPPCISTKDKQIVIRNTTVYRHFDITELSHFLCLRNARRFRFNHGQSVICVRLSIELNHESSSQIYPFALKWSPLQLITLIESINRDYTILHSYSIVTIAGDSDPQRIVLRPGLTSRAEVVKRSGTS